MLDAAEPHHPDLAARLPRDAYYHLLRTLRLTLPPPLTDDPEDLARRAAAAIAELAPANTAEANIAALHVAASEQWKQCLRLAQKPERALLVATQCRVQASAMMRQAQSFLSLLPRM